MSEDVPSYGSGDAVRARALNYYGVAQSLMPAIDILAAAAPKSEPGLSMLCAHALECALKAILYPKLGKDADKKLKAPDLGHNLIGLWNRALAEGLAIPANPPDWVIKLSPLHSVERDYVLRYMKGVNGIVLPAPGPMVSSLRELLVTVRSIVTGAPVPCDSAAISARDTPDSPAHPADEPKRTIFLFGWVPVITAIVLLGASIFGDLTHPGTHWTQRAGSIVTVLGVFVAFVDAKRSAKVFPLADGGVSDFVDHNLPYKKIAIGLTVVGTVTWGYADLWL
jgi:hypothetical protein